MRKVRWGVLGTADIARGQTIPGMQLAEHCELYAIAGRKIEKAKSYKADANIHGIAIQEMAPLGTEIILGSINDAAFARCRSLITVRIPDSVTLIGQYAFFQCKKATMITGEGSYAEQYCIDNNLTHTLP